MSKKSIIVFAVLALFFSANSALAKPDNPRFSLPKNAVEVAPNVFNLGQTYDKHSDSLVEGYAIVHKKGNAKGGGSAKAPKGNTCYGFMATGAKWKNVENWVVNPENDDGLSGDFVLGTLTNGIAKWETAAQFNILGNGTTTGATLVADETTTDNLNEVYFDNLGDAGTIGVTIVWGNFGGPTFNRRLVEWDQIYNNQYNWGGDTVLIDPTKMDFDNIATHELGHSVGMGDIYNSSCSEATMYGYGTEGETKKRTLAPADITGVSTLY